MQSMNAADVEQRQLAVLGLAGVSVSPLELARAYRAMLQRMPSDGPVARGLEGSVRYGMANPAAVPGLTILGKTGTASEPGESWTHGWFAGAIPGRFLIVVYVPHGDGERRPGWRSSSFARFRGEGQHSEAACALCARGRVAGCRSARGSSGRRRWRGARCFGRSLLARSLHGVTATPIGPEAWIARCAQCKHEPFVKSLHVAGEMDVFFGGMLRIADDATGDTRTAMGLWHLRANGIDHQVDVVLTLPSEHYVAAVLNAEAAAGEPAESLRALAILARTYALNGSHFTAAPGHLTAELCDSTECQAMRLGHAPASIEAATQATAGETLWFGGRRAEVFFSQSCGGLIRRRRRGVAQAARSAIPTQPCRPLLREKGYGRVAYRGAAGEVCRHCEG